MKNLLFMVMFALTIATVVNAQDDKDKVKKTSTIPQKVHNTVSKNKKYTGYKVKHKHNSTTKKRKVDYKDGDVKSKAK